MRGESHAWAAFRYGAINDEATEKDELGMTKAKARQRAKAKAGAKAKKRRENAEQPGPKNRQEQFGGGSIKGPSGNAQGANFGAVRRGAARSR